MFWLHPPYVNTWSMWNRTTAAIVLFLLLAHNQRPSLSENENLEPNSFRDCSWGSCSDIQENPSKQETETVSDQDPDIASNQDPNLFDDNPTLLSSKALGPEYNDECSLDTCSGGQVDTLEANFPEQDDQHGHSYLQKRTPGTLSSYAYFLPDFSKLLSRGAKMAYDTVHRLSADVLEDIASIVRTVFSEEAYNFVTGLSQGAINSLFSPGT